MHIFIIKSIKVFFFVFQRQVDWRRRFMRLDRWGKEYNNVHTSSLVFCYSVRKTDFCSIRIRDVCYFFPTSFCCFIKMLPASGWGINWLINLATFRATIRKRSENFQGRIMIDAIDSLRFVGLVLSAVAMLFLCFGVRLFRYYYYWERVSDCLFFSLFCFMSGVN